MDNTKDVQGLLKAGLDKNQQPLYIFLGHCINNKVYDVLALKLLNYLQTFRPFKQYVWIYYTQDADIKQDEFKALIKSILKHIPLQQINRINKFIIVDSKITQDKAIKMYPSNTPEQLIKMTKTISNITELEDNDIQLHVSILDALGHMGIVQQAMPFYGRDITGYPIAKSGIPVFLEEILNYYSKKEEYLKKKGVFRISGSYEKEQELVEKLRMQDYAQLENYDTDVVSTILKNSLANLKYPIFPYEMYEILKSTSVDINIVELTEMFEVFFAHIPSINRNTIKRMASFLHHVAEYEEDNLMGLSNLAIVFAPCFFRSQVTKSVDLEGAKVIVQHFLQLIKNVDYILEGHKHKDKQIGQ